MKATISATPNIHIWLSLEDVNMIIQMSERHYDFICRSLSKPQGKIRMVWEVLVTRNDGNSIRTEFTFRELDLLCKTCECSADAIDQEHYTTFMKTLREVMRHASNIGNQKEIELGEDHVDSNLA